MDFKGENFDAINRAYSDGKYSEAFALTYWRLLSRVEKLLDAEDLQISVAPGRHDIAKLLKQMHGAVDAEAAARGEDCPHNVWAAGLILRSLAQIFEMFPNSGNLEDAAKMVLLGMNLGKADEISWEVGTGRFDDANNHSVERQRKSEGGKNKHRNKIKTETPWHRDAMILYAVESIRAKPGDPKKIARGKAIAAVNAKYSTRLTDNALVQLQKRKPKQQADLVAAVRAVAAGQVKSVGSELRPMIFAALGITPISDT